MALRTAFVRMFREAPRAFLVDPVFRGAVIGAGLALAAMVATPHDRTGLRPPPPPSADALGQAYGEGAPAGPAPTPSEPIAPSRSLQGLHVAPDAAAPADRFGSTAATHSVRKAPDDQP